MTSTRRRARLLLVAGTLVVGFLAIEVGLRVVAVRRDLLLAMASPPPLPPPGSDFKLVHMLEPDPDPLVVYRLRAGLRGRFHGAALETNALGLRGPETTRDKPPGVRRLVGLGDSVQFGWGVEVEDRYLDRCAASLTGAGRTTEALALAVPGYNTVMEVAAFEARGVVLDPDVVVLGFFANDLDLPNFLWGGGTSPWTLRRSFLWTWIVQGLVRGGRRPLVLDAELRPAVAFVDNPEDRAEEWRVEPEFAPLVGWEHCLGALDRLAASSRERGFGVVVLPWASHPDAADPILDRFLAACRERGFEAIDPRPTLLAERRRRNLGPQGLWLSADDVHPNRVGHAILARLLEEALSGTVGPEDSR